jgi:predicted homoserine dehydrogenase-like protein
MNFEQLFAPAQARPTRAILIGAGAFGMSLIAQARAILGLEIVAAVDRDLNRVAGDLAQLDVAHRSCSSSSEMLAAIESGTFALTTDADLVFDLPVDMIVEATGDAEAGARHALQAIEAGLGVTMVSKEAECVVGPILAAKARQAGVPYTLVEGDQPALLISLMSRTRVLGLPIVCAGKSSEYDYVFDPASKTTTWTSERTSSPGIADLWELGSSPAVTIAARAEALQALPLRTVPDYCEMLLVANATGYLPDRPDFHAPLTRATELPRVYVPEANGGLLSGTQRLDVFNCLRRPDEASFAGGVFVVVEWADAASGALFREKGIPTSPDGKYGLIYNPSHLLGVEAPLSLMAASRLGNSSLDESYRPVVDLTARAMVDLPAGRILDIVGDRHAIPDLEPLLTAAQPVQDSTPLPYYMASGRTLARPVAAGEAITRDCLVSRPPTTLDVLRYEQDARFLETPV